MSMDPTPCCHPSRHRSTRAAASTSSATPRPDLHQIFLARLPDRLGPPPARIATPTSRELGAALRVNPNTIRAVYRRLADKWLRHEPPRRRHHVADRPPQRRGAEELAGIVAELLRRAAHAGSTADEVASATFAAATERKRPGPLVRVLFAECTSADAGYDAERLVDAFPGMIEAEGALIDDVPERLDKFHYDLVATTTFHADGAGPTAGRLPVVAMLVGPGYLELVHEIAVLPSGSRVGLVCANERGAENILETLQISGASGWRSCRRSSARPSSSRWSTTLPISS